MEARFPRKNWRILHLWRSRRTRRNGIARTYSCLSCLWVRRHGNVHYEQTLQRAGILIMLKKYIYRTDHGVGETEFGLILDEDHMPICFDTLHDWVMAHLKPIHRNLAWKLVHVEEVTEDESTNT